MSLASAALLAVSFPPADLGFVAWVALVPLMVAVAGGPAGTAFRYGWLCGTFFYLALLWWILQLSCYSALAALGLVLLALYLGVYVGAWAAALVKVPASRRIWAAPSLWVGLDLVRFHLFTGFPWGALGYSQYRYPPAVELARIFSVWGITFALVCVSTALGQWLLRAPTRRRDGAVALAVAAAVFGYGALVLSGAGRSGAETRAGLRVGLVQANVPMDVKWDLAGRMDVLQRHVELSRRLEGGGKGADILVWSETAVPAVLPDGLFTPRLEEAASELGVWILTGAMRAARGGGRALENSVFLVSPRDGLLPDSYSKRRLVPFGEYVPRVVPGPLRRMLPDVGGFRPGMSAAPLPYPGAPVGVLICYESIFPGLARETARAGATWLCNVTNDAWFGRTAAASQHAAMAVFRAVETSRPLVRCANSGVSMVVDRWGRRKVLRAADGSEIFFAGSMVATISPQASRTPAMVVGDLPAFVCAAAALAAGCAGARRGPAARCKCTPMARASREMSAR